MSARRATLLRGSAFVGLGQHRFKANGSLSPSHCGTWHRRQSQATIRPRSPTWLSAVDGQHVAASAVPRSPAYSPPPAVTEHLEDTDDGDSMTASRERTYQGEILCNRNLKMSKIQVVGFDMDYTLSDYIPETFETLAYEGARERLVRIGYPSKLLSGRKYDPHRFVRGLVVDKRRGNILKMDRHKYVKLAFHGFRKLTKDERDELYNPATTNWEAYQEPDYSTLDTLFSLPDAFLFSELVEMKDNNPGLISKSYMEMYNDVRRSVDICHRDGYIKGPVAADPGRYIKNDPHLIESIERIKCSGKKIFLLTNSLWDYTNVVMSFLYSCDPREDKMTEHWTDLFDVIITGAGKPGFLLDRRLALYRVNPQSFELSVDPKSFTLSNTEGVGDSTAEEFLVQGKIFQSGNWNHLHDMLEIKSGSEVLYVGDHMYSDILRTKRTLGWRTMLVIPELEDEVDIMMREVEQAALLETLRSTRNDIEEWESDLRSELTLSRQMSTQRRQEVEIELKKCSSELEECNRALSQENEVYDDKFNPIWGQLFKAGYQNSRFAQQVENYACVYTSKVSNMALLSPDIFFRCMSDMMPHDRLEESPVRRLFAKRRLAKQS